MSWIRSTSVFASVTHIGVSILEATAKSQMNYYAHRDGIIVDVGPAGGPETSVSECVMKINFGSCVMALLALKNCHRLPMVSIP